MVWIPGGEFMMGEDDATMRDARPVHAVKLDGFWIDRTEVTNEQYARFVRETGYVTVAERKPDAKDFPDAPPEPRRRLDRLHASQLGRSRFDESARLVAHVLGADWRHPEGPAESTIEGRDDHPVVQVCWDDAVAYARWAGKRLPTEAEWEYAARGGLERMRYTWGNELNPDGKWMVNNWQGQFPNENTKDDGYARTAPVGSYPPNGYGLCDMAGNVWEWCADWYRPGYSAHDRAPNPQGLRVEPRPCRTRRPQASPARGLVPVQRPLLHPLPARRAGQRCDRQRGIAPRVPLRPVPQERLQVGSAR